MSSLTVHLVRHEDADPSEMDEYRALSADGRRRMRKTAEFVAGLTTIDAIYASPLVRAVQTAEILASGVHLEAPLDIQPQLAFPASIGAIVRLIDETPASVRGLALVGHEPTLGVLANHLLGDNLLRGMRKGAVLALEYDRAQQKASFSWLVLGDGPTRYDDLSRV